MLQVDKNNKAIQERDIKNILDSESGRRFMWRVLSYCGVYRALEGNFEEMLRQEGRRQIGLYLLGLLSDVDDEQVFNMMREAKNKDMEDSYARRIEQDRIDNIEGDGELTSHTYTGNALTDYI